MEVELATVIKKSDFQHMQVVGQFNKAFIITELRDHLFLVDQHAADEKARFENYERNAIIRAQRLIE